MTEAGPAAAGTEEPGAAGRSRQSEMIRAAAGIFFRKGYRATTIQDIGKAMNFTGAALYYYFGSKHQILTEIVLEPNRRLVEHAQAISDMDIPAQEQLRMLVTRHVVLMLSEREMFGVMFRERIELEQSDLEVLAELENRYFSLVRNIVGRARAAGQIVVSDATVATMALLGMINWTTRWYNKSGRLSPEQIAQEYFDLLYFGIAPRTR